MKRLVIVWILLALAALGCHTGAVPGLEPVPASSTPTPTPTATQTPTVTLTPVVAPSRVPSPTQARTETPTVTPSFTFVPTVTASFTPTDTPDPGETVQDCDYPPEGGFEQIFARDDTLQQALGCPLPDALPIQVAFQPFENGMMLWVSQFGRQGEKAIYVLTQDGLYRRYADIWEEGQPETGGELPPEGRLEPVRGFGKVWREQPDVRDWLGWALEAERGGEGRIQLFETGQMVYVAPLEQTYLFMQGPPARWQVAAPF